jgi:PAS domain S-box-containing protein
MSLNGRILSIGFSGPVSYGVAIAATAVVVVLQFALSSILSSKIPALLFIPATIVSAVVGGLGPGILTTALCCAFFAGYLWMTQSGILMLEDPLAVGELLAFAGIGWALSALIDAGRRGMQRLEQSEEQNRVISFGVGDAVIVTDKRGHVTQMNPVAEALTGWMITEAKGTPAHKIYVTAENPIPGVLYQGITHGPINHTVLTSKSGREIPIDENVAPIKAADGRASGVAIIFRDARMQSSGQTLRTEMPPNERKVRDDVEHAAARLRAFQGVTDVAITNLELAPLMRELVARVRTILEADSATILLVDAAGEHLIPTESDGLREEIDANIRVPVQRGIAGRIAASNGGLVMDDLTEADIISPILREHVVSLAGVPIRLGEQLLGVIHAGSGVQSKFAEDDLLLLSIAAERIALAIERGRLHEASRAARAAEEENRAKDEFLAMLSHELRTPLNSILGWAAILRAGNLPLDQATHALEVIERNARAETELVESLLDLSRIMAGKLKLDLTTLDLATIVDGVVDSLRPAANAKEVLLESNVPSAPLITVGDAGRLQQIVSNLISNALKFTSSGGHIQIQLSHRDGRAEIQVADDGEGIGPEVLAAIFERSQQTESAAARTHGGLGLGLAIVRELVHAHGGTVVASSPGKGRGSTFTVTLPADIPANLETPASTPVIDEER